MRLGTKILILFVILAISLELTNARKGPRGDRGTDCPRVKVRSSISGSVFNGIYKINPKKVRGRHVYKQESGSFWIAMCPGPYHGSLGWCIGSSPTMETKSPVYYESGSTTNEPWQAGTFEYHNRDFTATVTCA